MFSNTCAMTLAQKSDRILSQTRGLSGATPKATELIEALRWALDAYKQEAERLCNERDVARRDAERWKLESQNAYKLTKTLMVERDQARGEVCGHEADTTEDQQAYAKLRNWDCFSHTEGAPEVEP